MLRFLLDTDALIKLHRAKVLVWVLGAFPCAVPEPVNVEAVVRGRARLYDDAGEIEIVVRGMVSPVSAKGRQAPETGLGAGELGVLGLAEQDSEAIVVSDDRRFLSVLSMRGVPFLTPVDLLVLMARRGTMTRLAAREAIERLRPMIRGAAYREALEDLEDGGER